MKIFVTDHNYVCAEVSKRFERTENILDADVVLTWSDIPKTENNIVKLAKELNKPVVMIQHGRRAIVDYCSFYKDIKSSSPGSKILADKVCVWGKRDHDDLIAEGYSPEQVIWTGSPLVPELPTGREPKLITFLSHHDLRKDAMGYNQEIHEALLNEYVNKRIESDGKSLPIYNIVVSPQYDNEQLTMPMYLRDGKLVNHGEAQKEIDELEKKTRLQAKEKGLSEEATKTLLQSTIDALTKTFKSASFAQCRIVPADQNAWKKMTSVFLRTKVCVSMMPSSFEGLACAVDVPIVRVKCDLGVRKEGKTDYELSDAVEPCTVDTLIGTIKKVNADDRRSARKYIAESEMIGPGKAIDNIAEVIKSCLK
jgi:hypothetical protein